MRRDLRAIMADGAAFSVMVGIGETYLPAFVLAMTSSQLASGLIATVPLAFGAALQLLSPLLVRCLRSYRLCVVCCASIQAATFVPLIIVAASASVAPLPLVFAVASIYWAATMAAGPAWNVWVETLVPQETRARFFARRSRTSQLGLLFGFVIGGIVLQTAARRGQTLGGFALLFLVAALARLVSVHYLKSQREPLPPGEELRRPASTMPVGSLGRAGTGRPLVFMLGLQFAVYIAAPYFTPYMFVHLNLSYVQFMILTCSSLVAKIAVLPAVAWVAHRWGAYRLLWAGALVIVPIPALWLLHDGYAYLMALQSLAGAAWAAYELAMLLLVFESVPRERRLSVLTLFNVGNAAAIALGSAGGGLMLTALGAGRETYLGIFLASAIARTASLLLLIRMPRLSLSSLVVATRPIALRPQIGSLDRPILAGFKPREVIADNPRATTPVVAVTPSDERPPAASPATGPGTTAA